MRTFLTSEDRTRIYCCLNPCSICGAKRGEYCTNTRGKVWRKGYHYVRTIQGGKRLTEESRKQYRERYERLKAQILKHQTNCAGCGKMFDEIHS